MRPTKDSVEKWGWALPSVPGAAVVVMMPGATVVFGLKRESCIQDQCP